MDIRDCLRNTIKEKGITQSSIAKKIGMTEIDLSNRLLKKRNLEANDLLRICKVISINPLEIWSE